MSIIKTTPYGNEATIVPTYAQLDLLNLIYYLAQDTDLVEFMFVHIGVIKGVLKDGWYTDSDILCLNEARDELKLWMYFNHRGKSYKDIVKMFKDKFLYTKVYYY